MPYVDPRWSEPIWSLVQDVMRYLSWVCVGGLIAVGACWYGGAIAMQAYQDWQRQGPPTRRRMGRARAQAQEPTQIPTRNPAPRQGLGQELDSASGRLVSVVEREAARGIHEIEVYLGAGTPHRPDPGNRT